MCICTLYKYIYIFLYLIRKLYSSYYKHTCEGVARRRVLFISLFFLSIFFYINLSSNRACIYSLLRGVAISDVFTRPYLCVKSSRSVRARDATVRVCELLHIYRTDQIQSTEKKNETGVPPSTNALFTYNGKQCVKTGCSFASPGKTIFPENAFMYTYNILLIQLRA